MRCLRIISRLRRGERTGFQTCVPVSYTHLDAVVGEHVGHRQLHQSRQTGHGLGVIAEHEEGGHVGAQAAVEGHTWLLYTSGSVNYEQTAEMIDWHLSKGIQNFFVNGLGAECHELTTEEKLELLKVIYGRTQGKAKIMACSFENSIEENKKLLDCLLYTSRCV